MGKMKYILIGCLFLLSACNDWLNVKPQGQIEGDKMFEDERGFLQTLTGTYTILNSTSAYGQELTVGLLDEVVRYWNEISEAYNANYTDSEIETRLLAIWSQLYKAVANANLVLDNLKEVGEDDLENYNLIKGEALGLRAYIHLDLLRMFGPVLNNGLEQPAIPYHEEFSNQIVEIMTAGEVLDKIERDLLEAYELLQDDPIKEYGRRYSGNIDNTDLAYEYRGIRMNYYAVCGTLARLYQLKNDAANALKYAEEVIDATDIFQLLQRDDIITSNNKPDLMFERELIWALYDQNYEQKLGAVMENSLNAYTIDVLSREYVYRNEHAYGATDDYRDAYWWITQQASIVSVIPAKYMRTYETTSSSTGERNDVTAWDKVFPMMRLSEMYYIAAEANLTTDPAESYRLLNEVRASRNLTPLPATLENNGTALAEQILYEYQKDFWGEGKLFYYCKHLFHDVVIGSNTIPASNALFVLPIPDDEIEFGGNE